MRPVRLELEGFTSFRERTVVDFDGVELFALAGPTGAGKSSVIDAMIFALYGTVPRLGDERLVAAVVSQGRVEAKVRLDFDLGGQRWTAVRVVRLRDGKATTREARLERGGQVVAGSARELDLEVAALLGLTSQQFTTCVVLPQGQFARFLQAKPSDRQDLLVRLLELGLYDELREAAGQRAGRLEGERAALRSHLDALASATPEAVDEARVRCAQLEALVEAVEGYGPALAAADRRWGDRRAETAGLEASIERLAAVTPPGAVDALAVEVEQARDRVAAAEEAEAEALTALDAARTARAPRGERAPLERWQAAHQQQAAVDDAWREAADALEAARMQAAARAAASADARAAAEALAATYEALVADHRAAALRAALLPGQPCPVCGQAVATVPIHDEPAELSAARHARDRAAARAEEAGERARAADASVARAEARADRAVADRQALAELLAAAPPLADVAERLAALDRADRRVAAADAERDRAAAERQAATRALAALADAERSGWAEFDAARDAVAALEPPTADRRSLAGAWQDLAAWAGRRLAAVRDELAARQAEVAEAEAERRRLTDLLDGALAAAGLRAGGRPHRDVAVEARAAGQHALAVLEEAVVERAGLAERDEELARQARVAAALKQELHANRFEKWVLDHVVRELCASASALLHELSQSAYSLSIDERGAFVVVDHANADEARLARTLSGGETFLASLALALALAEQVARAGSGARLESLFLDEGFGTLDAATLDVVAGAMEELGSRGRMVGLVSHVPELAERVPVRFEVARGPRSSTVGRVDR